MVARTQRIAFRIHEDEHALLLIVVQETKGDRDDRRYHQARPHEQAQRQSGQEHDCYAARRDHRRCPQVRLYQNQRPWHPDEDERGPYRRPAADFTYREQSIKARDGQNDDRLHEFRWLQLHEAKVDPSLTAARNAADQFDKHQRDENSPVGGESEPRENFERHPADDEGHHRKDDEPHTLVDRPWRNAAARSAVEYESAKARDRD